MHLQVMVIFPECAKNTKKFFQSLIARISGMDEVIFFKFEMWLPHIKLGAIWMRHHGSTYIRMHENCDFFLTHGVASALSFWAT